MATRDLTTRFLRCRSSTATKRPRDASQTGAALLGGGSAAEESQWATGSLAGMHPQYVDLMDDVNADIAGIKSRVADLVELHNDRLKVQFDEKQEVEKDREIDVMTAQVTMLFRNASSKLKRIARSSDRGSSADERVRQNIQRSLAKRLHELSGQFRQAQKKYLAELKGLKDGGSVDMLGGGGGGGGGAASKDVDMGFSAEQIHALAEMEESTEWRDQEIARIAKSVEELAVLFKDLATLVVEQGTMLDRIDYNVEQALERSKKGVEQLEQAEKYQKSARPLKCMAVLMVLIIIMVVILILQHTGSK